MGHGYTYRQREYQITWQVLGVVVDVMEAEVNSIVYGVSVGGEAGRGPEGGL